MASVQSDLEFDPPEFEDPLPATGSTLNGDSVQDDSSYQYEVSSNDGSSTGSLWSTGNYRINNTTKKRQTRRGGRKDHSNSPSPVPVRDLPRRMTKTVARFGQRDSDPDDPDSDGTLDFEDSDDDPEFTLGKKMEGDDDNASIKFAAKRFRGSRGSGVNVKVENLGWRQGSVLSHGNSPVAPGHNGRNRGRTGATKRKIDAISKDQLSRKKLSSSSDPPVKESAGNKSKSDCVDLNKECSVDQNESISEGSCNKPQVKSTNSSSGIKLIVGGNASVSEDIDMPELTSQSQIINSAPKRRGRPPSYFKTEISVKNENGEITNDPETVPPAPSSPCSSSPSCPSSPKTSTTPVLSTDILTCNSPPPPLVPPPGPCVSPPPPPYSPTPQTPTPTSPTTIPTTSSAMALVFPDETERKINSKLSSAYNYALQRSNRNNTTIRLPEGPQLTAEQLIIVESQFKSGDFVMAKKDADIMDNPPIWRIDGKSLLQKFQAFDKDGKIFYRNISTYSGWTPQAKALYIGVRTKFVFQSRYDTVVEMLRDDNTGGSDDESGKSVTEPETETTPVVAQSWTPPRITQEIEISEELRSQMPAFEIYLQTLISQALDNNFLKEIYEEYDEYFVDRVKAMDDLSEERRIKLMEIIKWDPAFKCSLDTWPCINMMIAANVGTCVACEEYAATKLCQLYGQPYHHQTLHSREPNPKEMENKNFSVCERCSTICLVYNKVRHQKYDYYSQCKSTVTNMRVTHPSKHTTTILRDLLANDHWIMGLFRSLCTTWIKVDRLHQIELKRINDNKTQATSRET